MSQQTKIDPVRELGAGLPRQPNIMGQDLMQITKREYEEMILPNGKSFVVVHTDHGPLEKF